MNYQIFIIILTIAGMAFLGGMFLTNRSEKRIEEIRKALPIIIFVMAWNSFTMGVYLFNTIGEVPDYQIKEKNFEKIHKSNVKITELADYTEELKRHLELQNWNLQMMLLIFFVSYTIPLVLIAICLSKPKNKD